MKAEHVVCKDIVRCYRVVSVVNVIAHIKYASQLFEVDRFYQLARTLGRFSVNSALILDTHGEAVEIGDLRKAREKIHDNVSV